MTVIIGSSGCGKTTLLKHLIRLYLPWSGSIQIFGREITDMDEPEFNELLLSIGVLFQNGALLNSINVAENVAIPLEQHTNLPYRIIERLIRVKLNLVELNHAFLKLPSELSGGMRKRAALARAIALDPALLLCDEPSAGLDPVTLEALDQLVLKMRDELGMSIVIVTHDLASIYRIADRVLFLDDGKVLFEGTLKETLDCGIDKVNAFFKKGAGLVSHR
ncbi:MAG: ATP-binding cassette domain-containing protein [candidate division KSB1 bacterium]|nr:ATP-binding cassette domain-containing protein [candidate division KSB1 bacterium]